jgi:hypothetical protein
VCAGIKVFLKRSYIPIIAVKTTTRQTQNTISSNFSCQNFGETQDKAMRNQKKGQKKGP